VFFVHEANCGQATQNPARKGSSDGKNLQTLQAKKLVLKDGNYQLVREYQRSGDRVKYFSAERGDWEEIPATLVDWDATAKAEAATAAANDALLKKVQHQRSSSRRKCRWMWTRACR
jgi:hypothetical protein